MKFNRLSLIGNGIFELNNYIFEENFDKDLVLVKSINVGVCSSDIPRAFASKAYYYPLVLGHEFSVKVIKDKRNQFKEGQRCTVFPLLPCFKCISCQKKKYNMCSDYKYYGSRTNGGMQTQMYINRWNLIPLPDEVDSISASLIEPTAVCIHASAKIKPNQEVLIYGGGFLAQIISQLLLNKNCKVTCIDRNDYKKKFFQENVKFVTNELDLAESSYDFVIESCGAENVLGKCIKFAKPEATILQLANPFKNCDLKANDISQFMRKEQKIIGTWNSDYRPDDKNKCDWNKTIELLKNKDLSIKNLISHKANLLDSKELLVKINSRKEAPKGVEEYNKAIIQVFDD